MKKIGYIFTASILFFVFSVANVNAEQISFEITANGASWQNDYYGRKSIEDFMPKYSGVNWSYSNRSSHRMWFRVLSESNSIQGSALLSYLTIDAFITNNTTGQKYRLQAKRENILDPITTVKGIWNA